MIHHYFDTMRQYNDTWILQILCYIIAPIQWYSDTLDWFAKTTTHRHYRHSNQSIHQRFNTMTHWYTNTTSTLIHRYSDIMRHGYYRYPATSSHRYNDTLIYWFDSLILQLTETTDTLLHQYTTTSTLILDQYINTTPH